MSSTYSPDLRIELIGTGDQAGVWGATTNNNMAYVLEQAIAGYVSVAVNSTNQALTYTDGATSVAADNQSVHASLALVAGTVAANFAIYAPPNSKQYTIYNATSYTATVYNSYPSIGDLATNGTGVAIPAGKTMTVWSDGTNFAQQNTHLISPTLASPTMTTPALGTPASGTLTNTTGFPVANLSGAGSGVLTFLATPSSANLAAAVTGETGTGALVFAESPTLVTPALGTPSALVGTNITGTAAGLSIGGSAGSATNCTNLVTTNFSISESGGVLAFISHPSFTASISSTTMTVTSASEGYVVYGATLTGTGVTGGTTVAEQLTSTETAIASPTYSSDGAIGDTFFVVSSTSGVAAGQMIDGLGIPDGTYVGYADSGTILLVDRTGAPVAFTVQAAGTYNVRTPTAKGTYTVSTSQTVSSTTITGTKTVAQITTTGVITSQP